MSATGLSADPKEYRSRLDGQPESVIDAWSAELMRDLSIREGVLVVLREFLHATRLTEQELGRVYAAGGGAPATIGRTADGLLMVPAISLHHFVAGLRKETNDARARLTDYLVANFHEIVFL